jgi:uncharacterized protein YfaS (alpha-2-macroglobulin family)
MNLVRQFPFKISTIFLLVSMLALVFTGCAANSNASAPPPQATTPTATPTAPPPPPSVPYTPVAAAIVSPVIVQRFPRRGEELAPDGAIELVFDRTMNQASTSGAFTLQPAAEQAQPVAGDVSWPDVRTMRFTPTQSLEQGGTYDVILTQNATAQDGAPLAEPFTFRFQTPGYLEVTQVIPADGTVDIETGATITVMFNRPIVPLTSLAEVANFPRPLTFNPPISGSGEWLNTSIYVFTPDGNLPGGTTFTAKVTAGLQDVSQKTSLPADITWQFSTQPPEVVFTTPNDGQTLVPIENPLSIAFSQPVDPQSAQANFSLEATGLFGQKVAGQFKVVDNTLTFTPSQQLNFDTTYQVTIDSGVTGLSGGSGMAQPYSFRFTTVPLPRIVETRPAGGETAASPYTGFTIVFNTPINPSTVMDHVEMSPALPITPSMVYTSYSPWNNSFSFNFGAKPSSDYTVRINPGIADPYGNLTSDNLTIRFRTAPLRPNYRLRTSNFVSTYDTALPAKIVVGTVNVNRINFRLYRLDSDQVTRPTWEWYDYEPDQGSLLREWQEQLTIPDNEQTYVPIDLVEGGGTLEPGLYLLDSQSLQVENNDTYSRRHVMVVTDLNLTLKSGQREAMVWATDLATGQPRAGLEILFFAEDDGRQLGRATTDSEGIAFLDLGDSPYRIPVAAVVLPANNTQLFSAVAENWSTGISPYDFGLEMAYNLPDFVTHIYTDRPIYRPGQKVYFKGVIRSDDDVDYRRPDLGRVQVTIQNAAYELIFDQEVDVSPTGTFNSEVTLEEGAALGNYTIGVSFADQYVEHYFQVAAYRPPEFEVTVELGQPEVLRGDDITATIRTSYFFGGPLAGADVAWNVLAESSRFAPPQLANYSFDDSDDPYTCFDCWWWYEPPFPQPVLNSSGTTDGAGTLRLDLDGQEINEALGRGSYRLIIEATATGPDNQYISGRDQVILHKGDYYLGLSPQENVADAGQETAVDLVAVDWAGKRLAGKEVDVQIIRYEWVNTFIQEGNGGYWNSKTITETVARLNLTTDLQGEAVARFTPPKGGSYQVVVQDAPSMADDRSAIRSSIFLWVAGDDDVSWRRENHDRITLISDKAEYAPGDTAEILIPSPFSGDHKALITIERGRIIQREVIDITSSSTIYRLPLTEQYAPNIYVSVVLVQGREGPTKDNAPRLADYKLGLLPIDVSPIAQQLNITLTPNPEQAQPDENVTFNLQVTDVNNQPVEAEFSLDLVDKAVLSLQPRRRNAIVDAFYARRGLGINTSSGLTVSANQFLLELAEDLGLEQDALVAQAAGGGDAVEEKVLGTAVADEAMPAPAPEIAEMAVAEAEAPMMDGATRNQASIPANVEVRADFSDTAYWNPIVVTGPNGQAEVTLNLPDNLTTWVMRGVGVNNNTQVGEATVELLSTLPLLVRPVAPRFFVVEDKAQLAANVSNNTEEPLEVEVTLATDDGVIIQEQTPAVQTVEIAARDEAKVTWDVTVQDVISTGLVFAAVSTDGRYQDASKPRLTTGPDGSLLVLRYSAPDIVGTAGQLTEGGERTEVIALPANVDTTKGEVRVQLDHSLAAGMRDGLSYLTHYEYECTEQTVSRFLPNVLTFNALQSLGIENAELEANLPGLVEEGLNKLYTQQRPDGGWGWWADSNNESNVHITAYVVFALTKAQVAGVDVSATVLANGQNFLLNHLQTTRQLNNTFEANRHAFILYVLAEGGLAPADPLDNLYEAREKLAHYGRAYLALALNLTNPTKYSANIDTLLSDLNNAAILSATGAHWEEQQRDWWAMNTDTRSTAIILDALVKLDPNNALIPNVVRWLMVARLDGIWETTQETAWALIALTDWMVVTGELDADYDYSLFINDSELASGSATADNVADSTKVIVPVADLLVDAGNRLAVARTDGNGRLYYSAHLKVFLPVEEIEPAERGVIVSRSYKLQSCLDEQAKDDTVVCNEVREARLGDVIRVDLTIIAPNDLYYVVVEDPLPAGAEAIDTGLATTSLLAMDPTLQRTSRPYEDEFYRPYFWWWRWYSRSELRDEKVVLFTDYLPKGTYEYSYTIRATLPGDYHVIPAVASEFYFPEVFGRSNGRLLSIGRQ